MFGLSLNVTPFACCLGKHRQVKLQIDLRVQDYGLMLGVKGFVFP